MKLMESSKKNSLSVNIPNYSGPLEVLLDLAKAQKVDLTKISITKLADEFLNYIRVETRKLNLELASEFLLMATWEPRSLGLARASQQVKRKSTVCP